MSMTISGIVLIIRSAGESIIDFFSSGVSKGEWIQIVITILIFGVTAISAWRYLRRERYPFKVRFSDLPYRETGQKNYRRTLRLQPGERQSVNVRYEMKIERRMQKLNFRFVEWRLLGQYDGELKWFRYFDAPLEKLNVEHVEAQEEVFQLRDSDQKGGQTVGYHTSRRFSEGHSLWVTVNINALQPWRGKLSLQLMSGDNRRGYGRATVIIGNSFSEQLLHALKDYKELL